MKRKLLMLITLAALVISGVLVSGCPETKLFQEVSVQEAFDLIEDNKGNDGFVILDVRRDSEYREGHLENALNLDYYTSGFADELDKLDKDKSYLVYCRSGSRSSGAARMMEELSFKKVYTMLSGITDWQDEGFSVVR